MNTRCIKNIKLMPSVLALTCLLSLGSNAQAYTTPTFAENGHALDTVMASLPYGYLSASAQTTVDSASATEDMQAAQNHLEGTRAYKAQIAAQEAAQARTSRSSCFCTFAAAKNRRYHPTHSSPQQHPIR